VLTSLDASECLFDLGGVEGANRADWFIGTSCHQVNKFLEKSVLVSGVLLNGSISTFTNSPFALVRLVLENFRHINTDQWSVLDHRSHAQARMADNISISNFYHLAKSGNTFPRCMPIC
jgi:hypothetical protein